MVDYAHAQDFQQCSGNFFKNSAPVINNPRLKNNSFQICYDGFAVNYSGVSKTPIFSASYLTYESLKKAKTLSREDNFHEEMRIPLRFRSLLSDYRGSGMDRGHNFPNGDASNVASQFDSFTLTNISPQNSKNNQNQWRNIEEGVRAFITKTKQPAYVVTGPIYIGGKIKQIGNGVLIPTHIYKVVYFPTINIVGAYVTVNDSASKTDVVSVAQLQQFTGITFFPQFKNTYLLNNRYNLPLSADAAYKQKEFKLMKSMFSDIFNVQANVDVQQKNIDSPRIEHEVLRILKKLM